MKQNKLLTAILTLIAILFLYFISTMYQFFHVPLVKKGVSESIKVYPSQSVSGVSDALYQKNILHYPKLFEFLVEVTAENDQLRFGEYQIKYPLTAWDLLHNMLAGTGLVKHRLTIVEGWTFNDIRSAITRDDNLEQTVLKQSNQALLTQLGSHQTHVEGLFYPDTYFFTWGNTDVSVLKTAYQKMKKVLQTEWNNRAPNLPYQTAYQALIVASMIEKETAVAAEKPLISSVIINRLAKHMRLQIDPTVQYGIDETFGTVITKTELKTKTPYNTYMIDGLPPTPICMPSKASIDAALHPATTDYLYYVANGSGGHTFSATYAEHEKAVEAYRQRGSEIGDR